MCWSTAFVSVTIDLWSRSKVCELIFSNTLTRCYAIDRHEICTKRILLEHQHLNVHSNVTKTQLALRARTQVRTKGNTSAHIILRGGRSGTNYDTKSIKAASALCEKANVKCGLVVDCSHGNSKKIHTNQPIVAADVAKQIENERRQFRVS